MADFFVALRPGIYRSGSRVIQTQADGEAWTQAYDELLDRNDALVVILDAAQRPGLEAGKPLALWFKARRDVLASKVRLAAYVVADPAERAAMEERGARAAKAFPYPTVFAGSFEEAERLAAKALAAGPERSVYRISDWNGRSGERWVANRARLDHMLAVFGEAAIDAAVPAEDEHVIDIGSGAGASSFALAARVGPDGHVLGIDISEALISRARSLVPAGAPVAFELADASSAALPRAGFDLLFSRFGVMFFDDPAAALAHMRRALKPGGRLAFVCWRTAAENDWVRLPMEAIQGIAPSPAPPDPEAPGPFSFGDRDRIARILTTAGFAEIAITPFDHVIPFGMGATREAAIDDALEMAFEVGPLSRALADQPDEIRARAADAVRAAFSARPGEQSVMIDGAAWIVTARNRS